MTADARIYGTLCGIAVVALAVLPACTRDGEGGDGRLAALERRLAALEQRATRPPGGPDELAALRERVEALEQNRPRADPGTAQGSGAGTAAPAGQRLRADAQRPELAAVTEEYRGRMEVIREEFEGQYDSPEYREAIRELFEWFRERRAELTASGQGGGAGGAGAASAGGGSDWVPAEIGGAGGMGTASGGAGTDVTRGDPIRK